jgi:hypothetical protein
LLAAVEAAAVTLVLVVVLVVIALMFLGSLQVVALLLKQR